MIDSSRSPRPLWKRTMIWIVLIAVITTLAWLIWVKELHHKSVHVRALEVSVVTLVSPAALYPV